MDDGDADPYDTRDAAESTVNSPPEDPQEVDQDIDDAIAQATKALTAPQQASIEGNYVLDKCRPRNQSGSVTGRFATMPTF